MKHIVTDPNMEFLRGGGEIVPLHKPKSSRKKKTGILSLEQ